MSTLLAWGERVVLVIGSIVLLLWLIDPIRDWLKARLGRDVRLHDARIREVGSPASSATRSSAPTSSGKARNSQSRFSSMSISPRATVRTGPRSTAICSRTGWNGRMLPAPSLD